MSGTEQRQHVQLAMRMLHTCRCTSPLNTWRNNDVVITSKRRHCDVITSQWRRFDVITTSFLRNVSAGSVHVGSSVPHWRSAMYSRNNQCTPLLTFWPTLCLHLISLITSNRLIKMFSINCCPAKFEMRNFKTNFTNWHHQYFPPNCPRCLVLGYFHLGQVRCAARALCHPV